MNPNKKVVYLVFILFVFFTSITSVKADCGAKSYTNKCSYPYVTKNGANRTIYVYPDSDTVSSNLKITDIEFCGEGYHLTAESESRSRNTNLFVVENNKLYCPSTIYFCYGIGGGYNQIVTKKSDCNENFVSISRAGASGIATGYTVQVENDTLIGCKAGGERVGNDAITQLNNIAIPDANSLTLNNAKATIDKIKEVMNNVNSAGGYCNTAKIDEAAKLANELLDKINENIKNSDKLTAEEKTQLGQEVNGAKAQVSVSTGKVGGSTPLGTDEVCFVDGLLSPELKEVLQFAMNIIRIAVPILLIILVAVDFGAAVLSNDKEITAKVTSKVVKRFIAALVVFFIPTIVGVLLDMPGISDWTSSDASCVEKLSDN